MNALKLAPQSINLKQMKHTEHKINAQSKPLQFMQAIVGQMAYFFKELIYEDRSEQKTQQRGFRGRFTKANARQNRNEDIDYVPPSHAMIREHKELRQEGTENGLTVKEKRNKKSRQNGQNSGQEGSKSQNKEEQERDHKNQHDLSRNERARLPTYMLRRKRNTSDEQLSVEEIPKEEAIGSTSSKSSTLLERPKKPFSAFYYYYQAHSKRIAEEHPNWNVCGPRLSKIVGTEWKQLPQEEKIPYVELAQQSRRKYQKQVKDWIQGTVEEENQGQSIEKSDEKEDDDPQVRYPIRNYQQVRKKKSKRQKSRGLKDSSYKGEKRDSEYRKKLKKSLKKNKILMKEREKKLGSQEKKQRLPVSSFFLFYQTQCKNLSETYKQSHRKRLAKIASDTWKNMSQEQKKEWQEKANENRERFLKQKIEIDPKEEKSHKKYKSKRANNEQSESYDNEENQDEDDEHQNRESLQIQRGSTNNQPHIYMKEKLSNDEAEQVRHKTNYDNVEIQQIEDDSEQHEMKESKKASKQTEVPQSHKPKGPGSIFFLFYQDKVRQLMEEHKDALGSQLVKIASVKWKGLSDEEKRPYFELGKAKRDQYAVEMQRFKIEFPQQFRQQEERKIRERLKAKYESR